MRPPAAGEPALYPHPFRIDEISEAIERAAASTAALAGSAITGTSRSTNRRSHAGSACLPDEFRYSRTRVVTLGDDSIVVQSIPLGGRKLGGGPSHGGHARDARHSRLAPHSFVLRRGRTPSHHLPHQRRRRGDDGYPSTLVQGHPDAEIMIDEASAQPIRPGSDDH